MFYCIRSFIKSAGFNLQQSAASSLFTYALPGQLVMAESLLLGASIVNIFIAVWLVNFRLYPMTVLFPLLDHSSTKMEILFILSFLSCKFLVDRKRWLQKN